MDIEQIMGYLPHRYPFLLVDRVGELEDGDRLSGLKNVTVNEPFFNGHFPGKPIMPGVLILEAMAQLSGILGFLANGERPDPDVIHYFAGADKVRFRRPVVPGDQLRMESRLLAVKQGMRKFQCQAWVEEELTCSAQITTVAGQPG